VLAPGALNGLMAYDWPGNVQELENLIERALIQSRGGMLSLEILSAPQVPVGREVTQDAGRNRTVLSRWTSIWVKPQELRSSSWDADFAAGHLQSLPDMLGIERKGMRQLNGFYNY
jgi:DNA-binding NtrC family response regulator